MNQQAENKAFASLTAPEPALATDSEVNLIEFAFATQFASLKLGSTAETFSKVYWHFPAFPHDLPI